MNIHSPFARREPVLLTADAFWLLKSAGVFSEYSKAELLDGALFGVPAQSDAEPESDASFPIKLRRRDYHLLTDAGLLDDREKTELVDGVVYGMSPHIAAMVLSRMNSLIGYAVPSKTWDHLCASPPSNRLQSTLLTNRSLISSSPPSPRAMDRYR